MAMMALLRRGARCVVGGGAGRAQACWHIASPRCLSTAARYSFPKEKEAVPVSELEKELEKNPFASRYQDKIKQQLKSKSVVQDGVEVFEKDLSFTKLQSSDEDATAKKLQEELIKHATDAKQQPHGESEGLDFVDKCDLPPFVPRLDSILHVHKLRDVAPEDIARTWTQHIATSDSRLSAVIPAETYDLLHARGKESPLFLYPLPQGGSGYDFYVGQFAGNVCAFTSLLEYQTHAENARPVLTLFHYTELKRSKGHVLMMGELDIDRMNMAAAQLLVHQLQLFYANQTEDAKDAYDLVRQFNTRPGSFDYNDLLRRFQEWFSSTMAGVGADAIKHDPAPHTPDKQ
ncbi:hypothetical protein PTSG_03342 [Salpingoeca rosetta]|uniref:ATP synthase mitochondrial F1 complex assembly factor 1 n=1 Tax=Salpingoeca rosetta (strain ATCC 50818 / BSB-021) TaxID=946362 RepID=F2U4W5_SALR5|nr:uncharacterized protein PTSG_03342 [Salpingoeca rosetta]EGD82681.1 hypothetical protein PTSG_03342 [Salpingoeca rosetta]|eukprot:XP_004995917.1 hypothetical protein PTSG_03342 [Salpingoeca rosetta]